MSDSPNSRLQQAYRHIENDEREKAQELLAPLLEEDAGNVHLWWVYAHAVRDAGMGLAALERVLELDPQYPGARELKSEVLEAQAKDPDLIAFEALGSGDAPKASNLDIDDWEDLQPSAPAAPQESSSRARLALLALLLIVVAGGGLVLSGAVDLSQLLSRILPSPEPQIIVVSEPTETPAEADVQRELPATQAEAAPPEPTLAPSVVDELEPTPEPTVAPTDDSTPDSTGEQDAAPTVAATGEQTVKPTIARTVAPADEPAVSDEVQPTVAATDETDAEAPPATIDAATALADPTPSAEATADSRAAADSAPAFAPLPREAAAFVTIVAEAIEEFDIDPARSGMLSTSLGDTLVLRLCAVPGFEFNARLFTALTTAATALEYLPGEIDAVAAGLLNCEDPAATLRVIGAPRGALNDFASKETDAKEFQRAWQPLS